MCFTSILCLLLIYAYAFSLLRTPWRITIVNSMDTTSILQASSSVPDQVDFFNKKIDSGYSDSLILKIIGCEGDVYGGKDWKHPNYIASSTIPWSYDYGPLQVNDHYHQKTMEKLGLDIFNPIDSLEYGIMLMKGSGLKSWKASEYCWSK